MQLEHHSAKTLNPSANYNLYQHQYKALEVIPRHLLDQLNSPLQTTFNNTRLHRSQYPIGLFNSPNFTCVLPSSEKRFKSFSSMILYKGFGVAFWD
uniref:Uncharacterized protein n=1 Tax=Solanum tuberosum TaxID=4113 RepID=M1BI73_SOLTU